MDHPNTPVTPQRRLHPLIAVAAAGVIVASLAATAAITGLFPKASSSDAQNDQTQTAAVTAQPQGVVDSAAPANPANPAESGGQPSAQAQAPAAAAPEQAPAQAAEPPATAAPGQPAQPQYAQQPGQSLYAPPQQPQPAQSLYAQPQQQPAPAYCATCGTVESVVTVRKEGHGTGVGAVGGAVAGGLVGNLFGHGTGRAAMTVLGAVGGGVAGNAVEKHLRSETDYQVRVRMENGRLRYFTYREPPPFQQGERVHIERGTLAAG
jgi:outer membrane lipoprotein SlyB